MVGSDERSWRVGVLNGVVLKMRKECVGVSFERVVGGSGRSQGDLARLRL